MSVLQCKLDQIGMAGLEVLGWSIFTNDTFSTVTATGYLNGQTDIKGDFDVTQYAWVYTTDYGPLPFKILVTKTDISLAQLPIILAKVNGTETSNAVTASGNAGVITTSSLTTAGGANYAITWTNSFITSSSVINLSHMGGTNTTQNFNMKVVPGDGTATLTIYNLTAATALNGTILMGYTVF